MRRRFRRAWLEIGRRALWAAGRFSEGLPGPRARRTFSRLLLPGACCLGLTLAAAPFSTSAGEIAPQPLPSLSSLGSDPAALFDSANKLYDAGKFAEAAAGYESVLRSGRASLAVYFNLGNACFKAGQIGRAIAAYRRAELLSPRDPDLRANLRFARNQVQGSTLVPTLAERALLAISLSEWTCLATAAVWFFFLLLTFGQWRPALRRSLRNYVIVEGFLTILLCAGLGGAVYLARANTTAIVITRDAVVRQGPLDESKTLFIAHDGAELRVLDQKDNWLQVATDSRHLGWMRRDQMLFNP